MELKQQVLNIYQAKYLQSLGQNMSDASLCWGLRYFDSIEQEVIINFRKGEHPSVTSDSVPTYTLPELLDKLNSFSEDLRLEFCQNSIGFAYRISGKTIRKYRFLQVNEMINAAYHLLCWAIEQENTEEETE